jgi:hypothetical protein
VAAEQLNTPNQFDPYHASPSPVNLLKPSLCSTITLMPNSPTPSPILCDSCGLPATPEHIRARMSRLEEATRHRPFHIGLLLISTAPPANSADDLYAWEQQSASPETHSYIQALFACVGVAPEKSPTQQLADLQRHGVYLASLVECPLPQGASTNDLAAKYGPTLIKRINFSYKPRQIALLAPVVDGLADLLIKAGFSDKLVSNGKGIEIPHPDYAHGIAKVCATLTKAIAASEAP